MLTDKKLLRIVVAVLFAATGSLVAVQIYGLQVKLDAVKSQVDGIKRVLDAKK